MMSSDRFACECSSDLLKVTQLLHKKGWLPYFLASANQGFRCYKFLMKRPVSFNEDFL